MKHIGWCLDEIQRIMGYIPRTLNSQEDKEKAQNIIDDVEKCVNTLVQLILEPNFKSYLNQLEKDSNGGVRLKAHEIEELFKDLEHVLYVLDLYIRNLRDIIQNHPEQWGKKADQIVLTIDQKFGGERGELRKEFQVILYKEEELKKLITSEKHLAEFLSW